MSVSKPSSDSGSTGHTPAARSTATARPALTKPAPNPPLAPKPATDAANLSGERGKAGPIPNFANSFGAKPKTMRPGSEGDNVKRLQERLIAGGADIKADGKYGKNTAKAVEEFQTKNHIKSDGIAGQNTLGKFDPHQAPAEAKSAARPGAPAAAKPAEGTKPSSEAKPGSPVKLPAGYESLEKLSSTLGKSDPRFSTATPQGRSANALALAIGGTEMYGKGRTATDFFTSKGGTGNNMLGFAQFNQAYHRAKTNTPEKYTKFVGDILHGDARMPNSKQGSNHVTALTEAVKSGKIKDGQDLRNFMTQRGFGGSNWQGIDDGWKRNPGLADSLVNYLKQGAS